MIGVGCLLAITLHAVVLNVMPAVRTAEARTVASRLDVVDVPPAVSIPAPPQPVARPARPVLGDLALAQDLTIAPTTFDAFEPVEEAALAPPPIVEEVVSNRPEYIPFEVAPELINKEESITLLQAVYPTVLKESGVGGSVRLWIYIDEKGIVQDCQVDVSSGFEALDVAAITVAHAMRFTPALMRDKAAAVWISQPIDFIAK